MRMFVVTALSLLVGAGCTRARDQENLGMTQAEPPIDVAHLDREAELLRALALPGRELDRRLGARALEASSSIKIEPPGRPAETLEETYRLDTDGHGAVRLVHDNTRGYGVEATFIGGAFYVRPRYARFVKRRPEPDEVERLRATVEGVAGDTLEVLRRWLRVRPSGATELAGHRALGLTLFAAASPSPESREEPPSRRWRETVRPRSLDGELVVDAASGALLGARFAAGYTFERDGQGPYVVTVTYNLTTTSPRPIAPPEDFVAEPARTRPMLDRQTLLDGLESRPTRARR